MKLINLNLIITILFLFSACSGDRLDESGLAVGAPADAKEEDQRDGISKDSSTFKTRPSNVLLTGIPQYRLTTVYKVNYNDDKTAFIGSNSYHGNYEDFTSADGNQWNYHLIPGVEVVYGYNMVNIAHYDMQEQLSSYFFDKPVLVKNLYFPSFSKDTLNYKPVNRNYFITSVYDDDTNKDGFINMHDLRRFYRFDIHGKNKSALVPLNYSVFKSEYDPANDVMYVFAQLDENANGKTDEGESVHIFWVDLKDPSRTGRQY